MTVGRNDPCPCGSGKKYKKCCLGKEVAEEVEAGPSVPEERPADPLTEGSNAWSKEFESEDEVECGSSAPGERPTDPATRASNARWKEFESEDYEGQIALFTRTLDEEELMDEEMAFEMLVLIYDHAIKHGEGDRLDALVGALRERLPEVYEAHAHCYLEWLITNAMLAGRLDAIPAMANELAEAAGQQLDTVYHVADLLAYHGQLSTLVGMMRVAWPRVEESHDLVAWAAGEFLTRATNYEIFDYCDGASSPDAADPELLERLAPFPEPNPGKLASFVATLAGEASRDWVMSDFEVEPAEREDEDWFDDSDPGVQLTDESATHMARLGIEYVYYLRREEGVPYTKGDMATYQIVRYICERLAGELEARESMFEAMTRPRKRRPKRRQPSHLLCPDLATLDCYLGGLLDFMNPQYHKAAVTFELTPAWLRFLEARHLVDGEQRERTLRELRGLSRQLAKLLEKQGPDPALAEAMRSWPENAAMEPPA